MSDDRTTLGDFGYSEGPNLFGGDAVPDDMGDGGQKKFFGKYRGTVLQNVDPKRQGRLMVIVPDVTGLFPSSWAMPCMPIGGLQFGAYMVPPIGAGVWVEFEQGNPSKPIWTGFYAGAPTDPPVAAQVTVPGAPVMVLGTVGQASLIMSDVPIPPMRGPGIMMRSAASTLIVDSVGVQVLAGSLQVTAPTNINAGALTVT
jgi:Type VI secretion system/phage-baseplate injector OB domain